MSDGHVIRARRVAFDWESTPLHWVPDDPQTTHTVNVLHLLLPAGERWFCQLFRQGLDSVGEDHEQLRSDVKGFIGQEAVHAQAHAAVLEHLDAQGLDARPYTRRIDTLFERVLADHPIGERAWLRPLARNWLIARLAITAAIEHFTCVLGSWIIEDSGELDRVGADPVMLDLLRWHGAEEVEHRCVAFDLFEHLAHPSTRYVRRVVAMLGVFAVLVSCWVAGRAFSCTTTRRCRRARARRSGPSCGPAARDGSPPHAPSGAPCSCTCARRITLRARVGPRWHSPTSPNRLQPRVTPAGADRRGLTGG
jgi:uncharacterized protein